MSTSALTPSGKVDWKQHVLWIILWTTALFAILWLMSFPEPMSDDLFYSGAGLNLANGGDLSNPLLARQHFPGHLFLIYPPIHSYMLYCWLKVFGISAASMTGYQGLMYLVTSVSAILVLRVRRAPAWLQWLVPLGVVGGFMRAGLRPEPTSVALSMAGFAITEYSRRKIIPSAVGFFLMALGAATAPRITVYTAALMLFVALEYWLGSPRRDLRGVAGFIAAAFSGCFAAFILFLWLIDFHLLDFWNAFHHYSVLVSGSRLFLLRQFLSACIGFVQWPLFPLLLGLLLLSLRGPWTPMKRLGALLAATLPVMFLMGVLGHGTTWFATFAIFALAAHLSQPSSLRWQKLFLASSVTAVLLIDCSRTVIEAFGIASGGIKMAASPRREEARQIRSTPEHTVLLDQFVARYVFDYRIPPNFIYYPFAMPFPKSMAVLPQSLLPGDICLLGPYSVANLKKDRLVDIQVPVWSMGIDRWSSCSDPCEVYVIHANELHPTQSLPGN